MCAHVISFSTRSLVMAYSELERHLYRDWDKIDIMWKFSHYKFSCTFICTFSIKSLPILVPVQVLSE